MNFSEYFYEHFLKTNVNYETWQHQLKEQGWEPKGEGSFATAYVHPNKNYVYKLFRQDPGYEFFLKFALENQKDSSVVKVKRIIFKGTEATYLYSKSIPNVIALEKLNPLDMSKKNAQSIFYISSLILSTMKNVYKEGMTFEEAIEALKVYADQQYKTEYNMVFSRKSYSIKKWRKMSHLFGSSLVRKLPIFRTIFNLFIFKQKNHGDYFHWDLHSGNFMIRPSTNQIVLTDPFVY